MSASDPAMLHVVALEAARLGHLIGLALGLGLAIFVDALILARLRRPFRASDLALIERAHGFVRAALALLWLSGLALLWFRTGGDLAGASPKLWAKLAVVATLTVSALIIGFAVMPIVARLDGERLGALPLGLRLRFAAAGALSAGSWTAALLLGAIGAMKTLSGPSLVEILGAIYLAAALAALSVVAAAPALLRNVQPSR